jgi:hypothetical protein
MASVAIDQGHTPGVVAIGAVGSSFQADICEAEDIQERNSKLVLFLNLFHSKKRVIFYPIILFI